MAKIETDMDMSLEDSVLLNPKHVMVELIPDYFAPSKKGGYNSHVQEDDDHNVGVVVAAHPDVRETIDHVIYFRKGHVSPLISLKEKGKFYVVDVTHQSIVVRKDQKVVKTNINQ
jgi:hypothetical protein